MDGINQLDLIALRVLSLQVNTLTEELGKAMAESHAKDKRIADLEAAAADTATHQAIAEAAA